jgi:hypothetical protein
MSTTLSVAEVLQKLEWQVAHHREQEALHAQQEVFHREQRAHHAAELEKVARHLEAFRSMAPEAAEVAARGQAPPEPQNREELDPGPRPTLALLVKKVVEVTDGQDVFGPSVMAREVKRRFGARWRGAVDPRVVSGILRRLHENGLLCRVREGRSYHEALYCRERPR